MRRAHTKQLVEQVSIAYRTVPVGSPNRGDEKNKSDVGGLFNFGREMWINQGRWDAGQILCTVALPRQQKRRNECKQGAPKETDYSEM